MQLFQVAECQALAVVVDLHLCVTGSTWKSGPKWLPSISEALLIFILCLFQKERLEYSVVRVRC